MTDDIGQYLFEAFRDWIKARVGNTPPVIRRRQGAPAPKGTYLVIDDGMVLEELGRASRGYRTPTDFQSIVQDWSGSIALWEIGARSATLVKLIRDLDLLSSQEFFSGRGITVFRPGPITPVPSLEDSNWIDQFRVELPIGVATGQTDETLGYIQTVDITNQIVTSPTEAAP